MGHTNQMLNHDNYSYCDFEEHNYIKNYRSLRQRFYWCLSFSLIILTISPTARGFFGIELGEYTNGDLFTEFLCVVLIFFCGASRFLTVSYYKIKNHRASVVDILLLTVSIFCFLSSTYSIYHFADDTYALKFIFIVDLLMLCALIKARFSKLYPHHD